MMPKKHILMIASENDGLPRVNGRGGKVGGIGDVIRDIPFALASLGYQVSVVTPSYGFLHKTPHSEKVATQKLSFAGKMLSTTLYAVPTTDPAVSYYLLDLPEEVLPSPLIYHHDPPETPFATDASKFAFFNYGVAMAIQENLFGEVNIIHLHDWHAGFFLILTHFHPHLVALKQLQTVFTIHNLSLQGIRPFKAHKSSLAHWFPEMSYEPRILADPRWKDTFNPMAIGIRLADKVHAVSPTYANEITRKTNLAKGFYGGEGLEKDLRQAKAEHRLFGILNGCVYDDITPKPPYETFLHSLIEAVASWEAKESQRTHREALKRLALLAQKPPQFLLTAVSRLVWQKIGLLQAHTLEGNLALSRVLEVLKGNQGVFICLGSGEAPYTKFLAQQSKRHQNFIFLNGFSNEIATLLYQWGDAFLMPSLYEPCGISQMLAMKYGQPCIVQRVGGLKDTVQHLRTGFSFSGGTMETKASNLVMCLENALSIKQHRPRKWQNIKNNASQQRFEWHATAKAYQKLLYEEG